MNADEKESLDIGDARREAEKKLDAMHEPEIECLLVCGPPPTTNDWQWFDAIQDWLRFRHGWEWDERKWWAIDPAPYILKDRIDVLRQENEL